MGRYEIAKGAKPRPHKVKAPTPPTAPLVHGQELYISCELPPNMTEGDIHRILESYRVRWEYEHSKDTERWVLEPSGPVREDRNRPMNGQLRYSQCYIARRSTHINIRIDPRPDDVDAMRAMLRQFSLR